jgi:hypothetical protein
MTLIGANGVAVGTRGSTRQHFDVAGLLFSSAGPAHATIMGRTSWFIRNPYPEDLRRTEDKYMIVNAVNNSDFAYVALENPLYFYRHLESLDPQKKLMAYREERQNLIRFLPRNHQKLFFLLFSTLKIQITSIKLLISYLPRFLRN